MNAPLLRPARSTDAGTVGGILSEFIDATPWLPRLHTRAEDVGFAGHMIDRGWVSVAERAGAVSGFAACDGENVHALYVAVSARRLGVGSALLGRLQAQVNRLSLWTFQANSAARAFYAGHGFVMVEKTGGAGNDEGLPDMRLEWIAEAA